MIAGSVRLAPGLGLTNRFIIDQHFRQRYRLGRLLTRSLTTRSRSGIGLDEDTAAFIGPDDTVEVEGERWRDHRRWFGGQLFVHRHGRGRTAGLHAGLRLHLLAAGATFNPAHQRIATPGTLIQSRE